AIRRRAPTPAPPAMARGRRLPPARGTPPTTSTTPTRNRVRTRSRSPTTPAAPTPVTTPTPAPARRRSWSPSGSAGEGRLDRAGGGNHGPGVPAAGGP